MKKERTLAIVKPDALAAGNLGNVISMIEGSGLGIVTMKLVKLTLSQAKEFYSVHRKRPFYQSLCRFMSSGPCVVMVLEGPDAISAWRDLMGPTDAGEAPKSTVRGRFGTDIERNAVHGSDAEETAASEIAFFFPRVDLV